MVSNSTINQRAVTCREVLNYPRMGGGGGGGGRSTPFIWPKRGRAAEQEMVFGVLSLKRDIQFHFLAP